MNELTTAALDLGIQGMSCTACAARIERALAKMEGVTEASVSYASRMAWIRYEAGRQQPDAIKERVRQLGFATSEPGDRTSHMKEMAELRNRSVLSLLLSIPLLWAMVSHYNWLEGVPVPALVSHAWVQLALATIIQLWIGLPFYLNAWSALRERTANMDVLVVIGTSSAYLYSHYIVFSQGIHGAASSGGGHGALLPVYFDTGAIVITAVLLGKYMESRSSARALRESDGYAKLASRDVTVQRADEISRIPAESVRDGDIVLVGPGELIPVDGIVTGGQSEADESLLTGESRPVPKLPGSLVWAGTFNRGDTLRIRTEKTGEGTMLSRIGALLRQAQAAKTGIQKKVDAWSARFVPVMLLLAALTFAGWLLSGSSDSLRSAMLSSLSVLLVACPCALGLATPISLVIASGKLARQGIVLKEAGALERLAQLDTVLLDKTGTLTEGRPGVTAVHAPASGFGPAAVLRLAAAAEGDSRHPYALSIRGEARKRGIVIPAVEQALEWPGFGAAATCSEGRAAIGGRQLAAQERWKGMGEAASFAQAREESGETVLFVSLDGACIGAIALGDRLRPSSARAVEALRQEGLELVLATGDSPGPAAAAAREAGIRKVKSGMLPEGKLELIRSLQKQGRVVAMAGDGWNDAPALAASDAGFAMGDGTDAALDAGHITLLRPSLTGIRDAIGVSRLTVRNIRQNLAFAFLYNAVMVPVAALGLLEPWMAGAAMALSSVTVVANSLRLSGGIRRLLSNR
ncbi:heavy metal translocating P-type ATPase [Paenibacillus humicus]|uniref:heavy metal translocating P-type ATPase n=1 Tax=Paenibacillus humicus TaxID=412861 RepID=UPI003F142DC2